MWLTDIMMIVFAGAIASLLVDLAARYTNSWRSYVSGVISVAVLGFSLADLAVNWSSALAGPIYVRPVESALASLYVADKFSVFVTFTILLVGIAVSIYSCSQLTAESNVGPFFSLLLILVLSLIGVVASGDLLTLFLFWEGMSIAAYGLVAFRKEAAVSLEAALKYLFLAGSGSLIALFGIAIIYSLTGSILLANLPLVFARDVQLGALGLVMLIVGLGVEAAVFPLHTWLPDAYAAAPASVSAILAGIVTETAVFALVKILSPTFILRTVSAVTLPSLAQTFQLGLVVIAALTMLIGNLGALGQSNVKRILSYSSIAHVGYMLAGLATFSVLGIVAILFHIWNHGLAKSSFFMLTSSKGEEYEDADFAKLEGLIHQNRVTGGMFALSSLGMLGVPPFGTFWSELLIIQSLLATQSLVFYGLAVVVILNIALSVGYFSRVITTVARSSQGMEKIVTKWSVMISPLALMALSLLTGFIPWVLLGRLT